MEYEVRFVRVGQIKINMASSNVEVRRVFYLVLDCFFDSR